MAVTVIGLLIVAAASIYIAWPLLAGTGDEPIEVVSASALEREKETALSAIGELDFDHRAGKITDQDHQELRAQLETRALRALSALDQESPRDDEPQRAGAEVGTAGLSFCPDCGHRLVKNPKFCPSCGANLSAYREG